MKENIIAEENFREEIEKDHMTMVLTATERKK
jgi:hypothetical protein